MDAIKDLMLLTLVDGLPVMSEGREIRYHRVRLRETNVADERRAVELAERVVTVGGQPRLMVSEATFRFAMTAQHVEAFLGEAGMTIPRAAIDLDLLGKLSSHDLALIEQRVFLITLAAEVRYGSMSQAEFDAIMAGKETGSMRAPQPAGQAADVGSAPAVDQPGPALLADFAGGAAAGAPEGHGR